jgi:hypothetical protein
MRMANTTRFGGIAAIAALVTAASISSDPLVAPFNHG